MTTTAFGLRYLTNVGFCADFGGRGFQLPTSLAIRSDGIIYVASHGRASTSKLPTGIQMVTRDHDFLGQIGSYGSELGAMMSPTCIVFDSNDNLYLADEHHHRITIFDREGNPVSKWGERGAAEGQFNMPSGLLVKGDEIYVVDSGNHRIQKYTLDGEFISQWGSPGDQDGEFNLPWGICEDSHEQLYVADWRNDRIQKFNAAGEHVMTIGGRDGATELNRPADVSVDSEGNIYVADWGSQRLLVLDSRGGLLESKRGEADLNPWSVEYLASQSDERRARESFVPVYEPDTDDPSEVSARMEPYFWDPVSVELDAEGRVYVLETGRYRFQIFERV